MKNLISKIIAGTAIVFGLSSLKTHAQDFVLNGKYKGYKVSIQQYPGVYREMTMSSKKNGAVLLAKDSDFNGSFETLQLVKGDIKEFEKLDYGFLEKAYSEVTGKKNPKSLKEQPARYVPLK